MTSDQRQKKIEDILVWFEEYDNQCSQYLRAVRRNQAISLHIGSRVYQSIGDMDIEADMKAQELNSLRSSTSD